MRNCRLGLMDTLACNNDSGLHTVRWILRLMVFSWMLVINLHSLSNFIEADAPDQVIRLTNYAAMISSNTFHQKVRSTGRSQHCCYFRV